MLKNYIEITTTSTTSTIATKVKLAPSSRILVTKARFVNARGSSNASGFVIKILTTIFDYQEIMKATLTTLNTVKVADLISSAIEHYPAAQSNMIRQKIRLANITSVHFYNYNIYTFSTLELTHTLSITYYSHTIVIYNDF